MSERPQLQMIPNANAEDVQPSWGIFMGKWAVVPLIGMIFFIPVFNGCIANGFDPFAAGILGVLPGGMATLFVMYLVNNRPPNYASDLIISGLFKLDEILYMQGFKDVPPQLWYKGRYHKDPRANHER